MAVHGIGMADALLGLDGFRMLEVTEGEGELIVRVETVDDVVACSGCGQCAESQVRVDRHLRDVPCFGRPVRLVWRKRRWRCRGRGCPARTWTETSAAVSARAVLTRRCGWEMCRQVGAHARPVAQLACEFGVEWWTVMNAVVEHGTPLVEDPDRVGARHHVGVGRDLASQGQPAPHPPPYVT